MAIIKHTLAKLSGTGYQTLMRPVLFRQPAQQAHHNLLRLLTRADESMALVSVADTVRRLTLPVQPVVIGGVHLQNPFILAAGFVKGHGYETEADALQAVERGETIIPGWRSVPRLVGHVEFGSFTRHPRMGNDGTVMWRDVTTRSTQNRVGLKNPGVQAAAQFLQKHLIDLPPQFGINIAISPGVTDAQQEIDDVTDAISAFLQRGVVPNWFTLNISCPNTEDDPGGNQTEGKTRSLCVAAVERIRADGYNTPLWVKISPDLAPEQYTLLMRVFHESGVKAVIATNTIGQPTPDNVQVQAGVGGERLFAQAIQVAQQLQYEKIEHGYAVDVIGCGGILDGLSYLRYKALGIHVVQYWSALVYRGPLAAAIIQAELA